MSNKFEDFLITAGSIVLVGTILKNLLENKYYKCPRCNYPVNNNQCNCPNCGQPLKW